MIPAQQSRHPEEALQQLALLKKDILIKLGSGPHATAYSSNELFNIYCVKRERSARRTYESEILTLAVSELLQEGEIVDFGGGYFGPPRPKE